MKINGLEEKKCLEFLDSCLTTSDIKHIFVDLPASSSLVKCLFKFFAHCWIVFYLVVRIFKQVSTN